MATPRPAAWTSSAASFSSPSTAAGIGVALVSRAAVAADLAAGRLVELPSPATPIRQRLYLVHRGADRLPPAAAELRRLLLAWPAAGAGAARGRPSARRKAGRPAPPSRL